MDQNLPSCSSAIASRSVKELNELFKIKGEKPIGNKSYKVTRLNELFGFAAEPGSFQQILAGVKNTKTGWTKDMRRAPSFDLSSISKYLLRAHQTETHIDSDSIELFTPDNLKRYKTLRSYSLYKSGHVHSLQYLHMEGDYCAVRGMCNPSWDTSGKMYDCIVLCTKESGELVGSNCSCTAGQGEACTHVAAILFSLEDFTSQGLHWLPDDPASTEVLCAWVNPKDPKVNPLPVNQLSFEQCTPLSSSRASKKKLYEFNPIAPDKRKIDEEGYKALVHRLNLVQPDLPFLTLVQGKSAPNVAQGETPGVVVPDILDCINFEEVETTASKPNTLQQKAMMFKQSKSSTDIDQFIATLSISNEERTAIDYITTAQANSTEWREYRHGMITGSIIHQVYTKVNALQLNKGVPGVNATKLLQQCLGKSSFKGNSFTKYGVANEGRAAEEYSKQKVKEHECLLVKKCGFIIASEYGYIGASPDRIVTCVCHGSRVLEVKCPFTMKDKYKTDFSTLSCVKINTDNNMSLNRKHPYYSQVQSQMAVMKVNFADFVIWSPQDILILEVPFDVDHWNKLLSNSVIFFRDFIAPALLELEENVEDLNVRNDFVQNRICANKKCNGVLKDKENICSDIDTSVKCECHCQCSKYFHVKCTNLISLELEDGEEYPQWFCPGCVRNCDIIY